MPVTFRLKVPFAALVPVVSAPLLSLRETVAPATAVPEATVPTMVCVNAVPVEYVYGVRRLLKSTPALEIEVIFPNCSSTTSYPVLSDVPVAVKVPYIKSNTGLTPLNELAKPVNSFLTIPSCILTEESVMAVYEVLLYRVAGSDPPFNSYITNVVMVVRLTCFVLLPTIVIEGSKEYKFC